MQNIAAPDFHKQEQQIESGGDDGANVLDRLKTAERLRQAGIDRQKIDRQFRLVLKFPQQPFGQSRMPANNIKRWCNHQN